jgi:hypothetical protein
MTSTASGLGWDRHPGIRTGRRLRRDERATEVLCRVVGSWTVLVTTAGAAVAVAVLAHQRHAGLPAVLAVGLPVLVLAEVSLLLLATRRAERIATELALYHLEQHRRAAAVTEDIREELDRLHADIARIAAHTEVAGAWSRRS